MITPRQKATIFGRYPIGTKIITPGYSENGEEWDLMGVCRSQVDIKPEYICIFGDGFNEAYIEDCSLLLTDLKDITEGHRNLWIKNGGKIDGNKEILWQLGYATSHFVVEDGVVITYSVANLVKFDVFKIRE